MENVDVTDFEMVYYLVGRYVNVTKAKKKLNGDGNRTDTISDTISNV